jgi:hypothetical protein
VGLAAGRAEWPAVVADRRGTTRDVLGLVKRAVWPNWARLGTQRGRKAGIWLPDAPVAGGQVAVIPGLAHPPTAKRPAGGTGELAGGPVGGKGPLSSPAVAERPAACQVWSNGSFDSTGHVAGHRANGKRGSWLPRAPAAGGQVAVIPGLAHLPTAKRPAGETGELAGGPIGGKEPLSSPAVAERPAACQVWSNGPFDPTGFVVGHRADRKQWSWLPDAPLAGGQVAVMPGLACQSSAGRPIGGTGELAGEPDGGKGRLSSPPVVAERPAACPVWSNRTFDSTEHVAGHLSDRKWESWLPKAPPAGGQVAVMPGVAYLPTP